MDKKIVEYRRQHRRCKYCKYCKFTIFKSLVYPAWYECVLKDKYICGEINPIIDIKGIFCKWYEVKTKGGEEE